MIAGLNEYGRISLVALRRPADSFESRLKITKEYQSLNYHHEPDFDQAVAEHEELTRLLQANGAEVIDLPGAPSLTLDSIYVRDAALLSPNGIILCNMGKPARAAEPVIHGEAFRKAGLPVLGAIKGAGRIEGGDVIWVDEHLVCVARGYRTNDEGVRQFRNFLPTNVEMVTVDLPHHKGPDDVFHLMSIASPVDSDLWLVYSPLMPVVFREFLLSRHIKLVEVPESEFASMACNVLAIAPRRCLMVKGSPITAERLRKANCEVITMKADAISVAGEGGPTCLTRPIRRL